jgi:hypothetical protein
LGRRAQRDEPFSGYAAGFDSGPDAFVAKYATDGELMWRNQLGTPDWDYSNSVSTDADGDIYISGFTNGSLAGPNNGQWAAWVAKYSAAGKLLWKRQLGTPGGDFSNGVATDGDRNVYISGSTYGSLGGANQGLEDAWIAKYSTHGVLRWKRQLGTSADDVSKGVATNGEGNVYISGSTYGSLGGAKQGGGSDAFVAKYRARHRRG